MMPFLFSRERKIIVKKKFTWLIAFLSIFFYFTAAGVKADDESSQNSATYSVTPVLSEHQTKNITSFYDIRWTPNGQEKFGIRITNHKNTAQTYVLQVNKATTNDNGMVDYSIPNLIPNTETIKINFPHEVTVAANATSTFYSNFSFPNQDYNGIKIFGIYVSEKNIDKASNGISNTVSYALPLVIRGNINKRPEAKINFKEVTLLNQNFEYQLKIAIFNEKEVFLKNSKIKVEILDSNQKVLDQLNENIDITPATSFNVFVPLKKRYSNGNYTVKLKVTHGSQTWNKESQLKISKEQANKIKNSLPKKEVFPVAYILNSIILILSIGLAYVIWKYYWKKNKGVQ